jgi:tetratricopeptide (TPR) repeat protein
METMVPKRKLSRILVAVLVLAGLAVTFSLAYAQEVSQSILDALNAGDTTGAINLLNKDIQNDPSYYVNYYMLGRIYFERKQLTQARDQFLTALDKKRKDYESLYYLGLCYLDLGDVANAEKTMLEGKQKAGDMKDRFDDGYGLVLMAKQDYQGADKAFRQAIQEKDVPVYHIHLGDANFKEGVPSLAADEYEKALKSDTGSTEVYYHWAEACLEMKDYQCALEKLRIVLTKDSTHADAWARAASIYFKAGLSSTNRADRDSRFKETIGSYRRYFELSKAKPDSSTVRAYFESAMAYLNIGGWDSAAVGFEKVLSIPYEPRDIYFNYGKALWALRQYDKAAEMFQKHLDWVAKQGSDYVPTVSQADVYRYLGDCYYYQKPNDFANAITYYRKSLETDSTQKIVLQNIAIAYHSLKSYGQAMGYYDRRIALGVDSVTAGILKNAGYCALALAGNKPSEEELGLEGEGEGSSANPANMSGVDQTRNYYQVAVDYLGRYLEYVPNDIKALSLVGTTDLFQLKDCASGVKAYDKILSLDPNNCDAKRALGLGYFLENLCTRSFSKALDYFQSAYDCSVKAKGQCGDVDLILYIAQAYHLRAAEPGRDKAAQKADFKNAYEWYGRVLKCDPSNAAAKKGQNDTRFEF